MKDITIVLPTFEEVESVGKVIDDIRNFMPDCRILVAYNPSDDGTADILREKKVEWVTEVKKGKGYNVRNAFRFINSEYIVMIDADYTYPVSYIPALLDGIEDVALGYRECRDHNAMTFVNFFGNRMLSLMASVLFRRKVRDVCTGMWAFRKGALDKFELESGGFMLEADLFVNSVRNKCKIKQIPIVYRARLDNSMAKLRITDGFKIGLFLIKKRMNWAENIAYHLCPVDRCEHYREATKYDRKCYYEPQCWRGRIARFVKLSRAKRYTRFENL